MNIIKEELPPLARNGEWVSLDTEMWGMDKKLLHRPTTGRLACLTVCLERDPDIVYITEMETGVPAYLSQISLGIWSGHHIRFDLTQLRRYAYIPKRSKIWDTMLIEQIMYGGYYGKREFSLADLSRRYLKMKMDKSTRSEFAEDTGEPMTEEQIHYACLDTYATLQITEKQRKEITKNDFRVIWKQIESPFMFALMDFKGFRVDKTGWVEMASAYEKTAIELEEKFLEETGLKVNSHTRVKEYLAKRGFKRLPNVQENTLSDYIADYPDTDATPIAEILIKYRSVSTKASRYGLNWINTYAEEESPGIWVVFGDYHQIGAETGRTACSDPNMQNVPNEEEYRGKFIARPGNKLIICDWSQQEPGVSTYLSKDKALLKANKSGDDIYIEMAKMFYGHAIEKTDPLRKTMKSIYLGLSYGLSPYGLAKNEGIKVSQAEALIDRFFGVFRGYARWAKKQVKEKRLVHTVLGRKVWLNPYSNQCPRNALNSPHQGTGSDMMKLAINQIHTDWEKEVVEKISCRYPYAIVAEVHDEFVLDVPELYAEEIADYVKKVSIDVAEKMCPGITFRVGIEIGNKWSAKE